MGLHIRAEWLSSVANKFADAQSRRFARAQLSIRRQLRRSVVDDMTAPLDVFPLPPLGEHPVFLCRQVWKKLEKNWEDEVRLMCPTVVNHTGYVQDSVVGARRYS